MKHYVGDRVRLQIRAALRTISLGVLIIGGLLSGLAAPETAAQDQKSAAAPDPTPTLRIETGMHTSAILRISTDAQCRLMATASGDQTVRLWSMPEGKLLRTQRLPIDSRRYAWSAPSLRNSKPSR